MSKILIYTFRTFPWKEDLEKISKNVIALAKLKEDIKLVQSELKQGKYDIALGVAKGNKKSTFETQCKNQFNRGKIIPNGKEYYSLNLPSKEFPNILINDDPRTSFCNWGMYLVAKTIEEQKLDINHYFIHILRKDLADLPSYL